MIIIDHRRNTNELLASTDFRFGIEVDLRNHGQDLIVTHDAFVTDGPDFEAWLSGYRHRFLIVNVKEEGLEDKILPLLNARSITDFFILDESFPFIRKWAATGLSRFALRVSEFEDDATALALADYLKAEGKAVDWIWVDSFTGRTIAPERAERLRDAGFRLCFVSPELHHVPDPASWEERVLGFQAELRASGLRPDAVCSKLPHVWQAYSGAA